MRTHVSNMNQIRLLRRKCAKYGLSYAKRFAKAWVKNGQPGFLSSRELCNLLSYAVEKNRNWMNKDTYLSTKYGSEIYWHMWS